MQSVPAEGTVLVKKPRGRPRGSRVSQGVQFMRQTGNPNLLAAQLARAIIEHHRSREEKEKRLRDELAACEASGGDVSPMRDALQMLDTNADLAEEKRVTHKKAVRMAIEHYRDGVSKPIVTVETDAAGRPIVSCKPSPKARRLRLNANKVLELLRRGRA
jgi:hypothetical protein